MVHFGKYLERHLVAEWRDSYCNYKKLKKMLRRAAEEKQRREMAAAGEAAESAPVAGRAAATAPEEEELQLQLPTPRHAWMVAVEPADTGVGNGSAVAAAAASVESPRRAASLSVHPEPDPGPDSASPAAAAELEMQQQLPSAVPPSLQPLPISAVQSALLVPLPPPPSVSPPLPSLLSVPTTPPPASVKLRLPNSARAAARESASPEVQAPHSARNASTLNVRVEESPAPSPLLFLAHRPEHLAHLRDYTRRASPLLAAAASGEASPVAIAAANSALLAPDFVLDAGGPPLGSSHRPSPPPANAPLDAFLEQLEVDFANVQRFFHDHELRLEARFLALQSRIRQRRWGRVGDAGPSPDAVTGGTENGIFAAMVAAGADADAEAEAGTVQQKKDATTGQARSRSQRLSPAAVVADAAPIAPLLRANSPEAVELRELYHAALLLDNYRLLNATAFLKIAKKFDKQMGKGKNGTPRARTRAAPPAGGDVASVAAAIAAEGNPPLHLQVQARLAAADFSTSTRIETLLDTMLHLYARAFNTGTGGGGSMEAALEAARRALDFPLPPVSTPDVRWAAVLVPLVSALVVAVIVLALWWQSLLDEVDAVTVLAGGNPRDSCMGQSLESGVPKCTGAAFAWSLSSSLPVYRCVGVVLLHVLLWSGCVTAMRRFRVNYVYLLDFDSASVAPPLRLFVSALALWVVFLVTLVWQLGVWIHYAIAVRDSIEHGREYPLTDEDLAMTFNAPHLFLMVFFVFGVLLNPAPIFLRSGRWWLLSTIGSSVITPFAKLEYKHTWVTNQLSTVTRVFSDGSYALCFETVGAASGWTHAASRQCTADTDRYWFWLSTLPSWWRMVQSLRRFAFQDRSARHMWNALKYGNRVWVSVLAWVLKLASTNNGPLDPTSEAYSPAAYDTIYNAWMAFTLLNVAYSYWWDVRKDWGLEGIQVRLEPARNNTRAAAGTRGESGALLAGGARDQVTSASAAAAAAAAPSLWSRLQPSRIRLSVRRMLLLPHDLHWFYLLSIVFDLSARVASLASRWTDVIFGGGFNAFASTTILAAVECIRRNWASFHRLENEHMSNSEKFREIEKLPAITPADFPEAAEAAAEAEADAAAQLEAAVSADEREDGAPRAIELAPRRGRQDE